MSQLPKLKTLDIARTPKKLKIIGVFQVFTKLKNVVVSYNDVSIDELNGLITNCKEIEKICFCDGIHDTDANFWKSFAEILKKSLDGKSLVIDFEFGSRCVRLTPNRKAGELETKIFFEMCKKFYRKGKESIGNPYFKTFLEKDFLTELLGPKYVI